MFGMNQENMIKEIINVISESNGYILIPNKEYKKFEKKMNRILIITPNKLIIKSFFALRGIPIISGKDINESL
jgi:hypothetical protein